MIHATGLAKHFGDVQAVSDVSFSAPDGAITGLLGPNGAGKTTAMRCVEGLLKPDQGHVDIDGIRVGEQPMAARQRLGVLPDQFGLYARLTTREHLAYFGRLHDLGRQAVAEAIDRVAGQLHIDALLDRRVEGFSAGERMKVGLARALLHNPQNLVLDEPTRGLDVMSTRGLRDHLRLLRSQGRCVVFSSHVMQEVEELCDHLVIVGDGIVKAAGSPAELCARTGQSRLEDAFVRLIEAPTGVAA